MTSVVQLAGTIAVHGFAVVTLGALQVALAGTAVWIPEVSVIARIAVWRAELLSALALSGGVGAVSG